MDYSELSKSEINLKIAKILIPIGDGVLKISGDDILLVGYSSSALFNWCDRWADAGQLMEDNKIELSLDRWEESLWNASDFSDTFHGQSKNPKRAIAECFLMMNEV